MQKSIDFLTSVWGVQAGGSSKPQWFCISTKSVSGGKWREHFLKWPITEAQFEDFFDTYPTDDYNLYFCPHGFSSNRRLKKFALPTAYLWADLDEADPARCKPRPQLAWESSPGRHAALWRLNEHHDPEDIEEVNKALTYSSGADNGGWDLTQVLRIPFTRNHKYPKKPLGKLLWSRDNKLPLGDFPDMPEINLNAVDVLESCRTKLKGDTYRLLTARFATKGVRSEMIWRLENDLLEAGLDADQVFALIKASVWNKFKGRRDEDTQLRRELSKATMSAGSKERPSLAGHRDTIERPPLKLVRMSDVEPEDVTWMWWPYIPNGKITIIEGDPGLGKSWFTMALASFLSRGRPLPSAKNKDAIQGRVLIMSAEDGLGDTIRPRLDQLDADPTKIFAIPGAVTFDEEGMADIETHVEKVRPRAIIVDPLVAYIGANVDLHKANETRAVMTRLSDMAEKYSLAVILVRHLTKGGRDKSIYRGIGSIDLTAAARSVMIVGRNPDDPDEGRVICQIKSNLGPLGKAQSYSLRAGRARPFAFEGEVSFTAEEVFKAEATGGAGQWEIAQQFLSELLKAGARWADEVRRDAEAKGYSIKLVNQLKRDMKLKVVTVGDRVKWQLPSGETDPKTPSRPG